MLGSSARIASCAGAAACPERIAARGRDEDGAVALASGRLDPRLLNPANMSEPAVVCDRAAPPVVFDGPAPEESLGFASERCVVKERKRFLILSMDLALSI
jgi:hypothetical protein